MCGGGSDYREFYAARVVYRVCGRCGSAHAAELMDLDRYYEGYFPAGVQADSPVLARRYGEILARLERQTGGRRVLEVGCGNGQLLAVARGRGWEVAGVELSRAQVEHCRGRGLEVELGDLRRDGLFAGRVFDAAVMIEVLEHLPEPVETLEAVAERLVPGGVLYLTTPNLGALSRSVLGGAWSVLNEEHVTLASARGLRRLLARGGFRPLSVRSRNVNVGELLIRFRRREAAGGAPLSGGERFRAAAALRDRMEGSPGLRVLKGVANAALGLTGLGDTLVAWAVRERGGGGKGLVAGKARAGGRSGGA